MNKPIITAALAAVMAVAVALAWRKHRMRFLAASPRVQFPQAELLAPHVWVIPNFLTESEVLHLRAIGASSTKMMQTSSSYESVEFRRPWEPSSDPIVNSIESRIGNLAGIPPNTRDSPLRLSVSRPWVHDPANDGKTHQLQNLHHDKLKAPERVLTTLLYLSDAPSDGLRGGDTIFPCAARPMHSSPLCDRLQRAFEEGDLFLSPPGGIHSSHDCFDASAAAAVSDLCADSHRSSSNHGEAGDRVPDAAADHDGVVRVTPERGTALLFLHEAQAGGVLTRSAWHGGCRVASGSKWTMQQFKALAT